MYNWIKKYILFTAAVFVISALTAVYAVQETHVTGNSMSPCLRNGESVLVDKIAYQRKEPERYDVVVFRYLYEADSYYIKRIIGLPGETVQIKDGSVHIDGEKLEDPFGGIEIVDAGRAAKPVQLKEDEYFVMGDNRNYSTDSREDKVGNVRRQQILGKAVRKLRSTGETQLGCLEKPEKQLCGDEKG